MDTGTNHLGFRCMMTQPMWDARQKENGTRKVAKSPSGI
jgi:hypothetical protein